MLASQIIYACLMAIWTILAIAGMVLFYRHRHDPSIKVREPIMAISVGILGLIIVDMHLLRLAWGPGFHCAIPLWIPSYCLPLMVIGMITRFLRLGQLHRLAIHRLEQSSLQKNGPTITIASPTSQTFSRAGSFSQTGSAANLLDTEYDLEEAQVQEYVLVKRTSILERINRWMAEFLSINALSLVAMAIVVAMSAALIFITVSDNGSSPELDTPIGCRFGWRYFPMYGVTLLASLPAIPIILGIRGLRDAFGFWMEMYVSAGIFIIGFALALGLNLGHLFHRVSTPGFPTALWVLWACISLHHLIFHVPLMEVLIPARPVEEEGEQSSWSSFMAILHSRERLMAFREHAVTEFSVENVLFIENLWEYRQARLKSGGEEATLVLYNQFIRPGSDMELNLQGETMASLRRLMEEAEAAGEGLHLSEFNKAEKEVLRLMYESTYPRFLRKEVSMKKDKPRKAKSSLLPW